MATKPLPVYNLDEGVNVDADDIHVRDGELRSAQNWQIDTAGGLGGIRRRDGMSALNSSAMSGAVNGIISLPLPDRSTLTRKFYAAIDQESATHWRTSTDGATWANDTSGEVPAASSDLSTFGTGTLLVISGALQWIGFKNKLYYAGSDYVTGTNEPTIHVWDGTTDYQLAAIPRDPSNLTSALTGVLSFVPYDDHRLMVTTVDAGGAGPGRLFLLSVDSGQLTQVGPETNLPNMPMNPVKWGGKIWVGLVGIAGGSASTVRWARPEDATWTTDLTLAAGHGYVPSAIVFLGNLYIGTAASVGTAAILRKRTSDGVWSTVHTVAGMEAVNYVTPMIVSLDGLTAFAMQQTADTTPDTSNILETTDGTTWTVAYDIEANIGNAYTKTGFPIRDTNGDIYWVMRTSTGSAENKIIKRTNAGVFSVVDTANFRGPIGYISF